MEQVRSLQTNPPLRNINGATSDPSASGSIYVATNGGPARGLWILNLTSGEASPVLNNYRGRHLNSPNDLVVDSHGNIYFTDPCYGWLNGFSGVAEPELPNTVYHFNAKTKAVTALTTGVVAMPNGLCLSADERTLFVADSDAALGSPTSGKSVWAFDFLGTEGTVLSNPRVVYQAPSGWPDGIRVSKSGLLMVTAAGGVDVVDPLVGLLLGRFNSPGDIIYNVEAAKDGVWLLTGGKAIYKVTIGAEAERSGKPAARKGRSVVENVIRNVSYGGTAMIVLLLLGDWVGIWRSGRQAKPVRKMSEAGR